VATVLLIKMEETLWPNSPESCVDVVEATTIDLSCARTGAPKATLAAMATRQRRVNASFL
jgi:hypothetical protein